MNEEEEAQTHPVRRPERKKKESEEEGDQWQKLKKRRN